MKIYSRHDGVIRRRPDGTETTYYLFDEYELHANTIPPHATQEWHHHEKVHEVLYLIEGELVMKWRENDREREEVIYAGCVVEMENSPHTIENRSDSNVSFLIMKVILKGNDNKEVFKEDKILD